MGNAEEVVEEIVRIQRSLPPRPSVEEVEAALSLMENAERACMHMLKKQTEMRFKAPPDVPEEVVWVVEQMRSVQIQMQAEDEKREAVLVLGLEDRHRLFDYLLLKAAAALPSSSSSSSCPSPPTYLLDVSFNGGDTKYSRDDSFIQNSKCVIRSKGAHNPTSGISTFEKRPSLGKLSAGITGDQKLSLLKLASLIETTAKEGAEILDLQGRLTDQVEWIPDSIGNLSKLNEINLSENAITTIPSLIQGLSMLRTLDLHTNKLVSIPDAIGDLFNLNKLDLHSNCVQILPSSIGKISRLVYLDLSSNQLSSLPDSVGHLVNLERLNIERNDIEELPYTIGQCTSLTEIRADFNHIKALPEAVGKLESLLVLTLHYNNIKSLPTTMGSLLNLRELDVSFNELESIPESLCLATSLVKLNVSRNFADLQRLPWSIGNLEILEELDISNDQINILPDSFSKLTNLQVLHAEETPLQIPPREILEIGAKAAVNFMVEYVTKKNESVRQTKPKWMWSKFCSCLKKCKREERNGQYIPAGA